jgi:PilZ domain
MRPNTNKSERRREQRVEVNARLAILCTDGEGRETRVHAHLIDISVKGARMRVPLKLQRGTTVYFFSHQLSIGGRGTVRFCNTHPQGYEIGLEFPGGTGWKGAESADLLALAAKVTGHPAIVEAESKA